MWKLREYYDKFSVMSMNYHNVAGKVVQWLVPTQGDWTPPFAIHGYIHWDAHNHIEIHIIKMNKNTSFYEENFRNISFSGNS